MSGGSEIIGGLEWPVAQLKEVLCSYWPQAQLDIVACCGSTSSVLMDTVRAGNPAPTLLVAAAQTAGRGRMGKEWHAQPGMSLTFSVALPLAPADWSGLSLAMGVALAQALEPAYGSGCSGALAQPRRIGLKWPNDLWLIDPLAPGRKLGGILLETVGAGRRRWLVLGIGLNVGLPTAATPAGLLVACLREWEPQRSVPEVLLCVLPHVLQALAEFEQGGFALFESRFTELDILRDRPVIVERQGLLTSALALGVTAQGALRILGTQGVEVIQSGLVSVRPDAARVMAEAEGAT